MTDTKALKALAAQIPEWASELGFQQAGITDTDLSAYAPGLKPWLENGHHGNMEWMAEHQEKRTHPELLHPGTLRVISLRMNYLPPDTEPIRILKKPEKAYVSRYANGRDYHKLIRKRLARLAERIREAAQDLMPADQRPFVDSAPVMERPLAAKAGLGWVGKHTLVLNRHAGSWFFLGEIFTNLPLPVNQTLADNECGECTACLKVCPTDAFPEPYVLDARRCISYLTIENKGPIPEEFRQAMGNRVFGCDDCQAICPWNKYATPTDEQDFHPRHNLHNSDLIELFEWSEETFLQRTQGSPLRRIGYELWQRNLSVGLGNAPQSAAVIEALERKLESASALVAEHIEWALQQQKDPNRRRARKIRAPGKPDHSQR